MSEQTTKQYLEAFFAETNKVDPDESFEVQGEYFHNFISYGVVIEAIMSTSDEEQRQIAATIRKIDFLNGDVAHFLRYLGAALAI